MRITLIIATLGSGGAERVMALMANSWAEQGYDITLVTLGSSDADFYTLDPRVCRVGLDLMRPSRSFIQAMSSNVRRLRRLRQAMKASRPDVIVSFVDCTNVLVLLSSIGLRTPVVASEHTDPRHYTVGVFWTAMRRLLYRRAAALVVLTERLRPWAEGFIRKEAVYVIPNPVQVPPVSSENRVTQVLGRSERTVAAMGRLGHEKGFDLLLQAFARCAGRRQNWSLMIIGEGDERPRLEAMARDLGIKDRVLMPGRSKHPFPILRTADLFVLPSRLEGFPMALVEAMACGLPVICTDFPSGARDIVRDGIDAIVVPPNDVKALGEALDRLMEDPAERQRLGARAIEVADRFSLGTVMSMWNRLLRSAC
jgi:GalNAc-alpha-(1->4)-GalNAc-alpha-(1->3)-diNAcBac-PP-undecaprenol alpha-1,4-N-acetyl-D-galactosaminyltransferase